MFQLKIELRRFRPPVWRRVLIPASATLGDLHEVIQVVMDWDGDHLHSFTADGITYSSSYHRPPSFTGGGDMPGWPSLNVIEVHLTSKDAI